MRAVCRTPSQLSKFLKQFTYNIETDYLYNMGIEKGIEQGIEIGHDIAMNETKLWKLQVARKMLADGLPTEKIAEFLELAVNEVEQLRQTSGK